MKQHIIDPEDMLMFIVAITVILIFIFFTPACASKQHMRETLQAEHPNCFVMEDLFIECPNPFIDNPHNSFVEVHKQKKKRTKNIKRKD